MNLIRKTEKVGLTPNIAGNKKKENCIAKLLEV